MIPLLKPGEPITEARLNQIINAVNAANITSSDFPLERTAAGTKLKMPRRPQDFYARIVESEERKKVERKGIAGELTGLQASYLDVKDGEYEWREVYLPGVVQGQYPPEEFEDLPEGAGLASYYDADNDKLLEPAYELSNDRTVPVDTLVRMRVYPGVHDHVNDRGFIRRYIFGFQIIPPVLLMAEAIRDWDEHGVYPHGEPKILCQQLVPDPDVEPSANNLHPKKMLEGSFQVELPRERKGQSLSADELGKAHSADPALYVGDRLRYSIDDQGRPICESPYLHMGKIGEIRTMGRTTISPVDNIPTGWAECKGQTAWTQNAGMIALANFDRDYTALSGNADKYGAGPVHRSSSYAVGEVCYHATFDAHGESVFARVPMAGAAAWYDTSEELAGADAHRHDIKSAQGEFPMETVLFYERYK
ncbi:MAG: hypothetical protein V3U39_12340 [Acidimicrobiia bacterium]